MKILLVVDLQQEFVKDDEGRRRYNAGLKYIAEHTKEYDCVTAFVYRNNNNPNMKRLVGWEEMREPEPLDFKPQRTYFHSGYSVHQSLNITEKDEVDVFGLDTDACVLAACFELFDLRCNFRILTDLCWSSGGKVMHESGLTIMRRQFRKAVVEG